MPLISRGAPAFASSNLYPAKNANDGDYSTAWRGSIPSWLAYDLSGVPAAQRRRVVVGWFNDPMTTPYDHVLIGDNAYNNLRDYTIDANAAPGGGSPPASGWVTLATVAGNHYHSRQHLIDLTGYNWVRINVTASDGSSGNSDAAINFDVHDASQGVGDDWMLYGDSITQDGLHHEPVNGTGNFGQLITAAKPGFTPLFEDGGIGGLLSSDGAQNIGTWLSTFPGRYVALNYGTNDANSCVSATTFSNNYVTMVKAVLAVQTLHAVPVVRLAVTDTRQKVKADSGLAKMMVTFNAPFTSAALAAAETETRAGQSV